MEPTETPDPKAKSSSQKRILLVEDDDAWQMSILPVCKLRALMSVESQTVKMLLQLHLKYNPDLVLLDVMMPRVSGFDVLDILRNTPETANLKITMLTALGQESDMERAKALGVNDYLVKSQVVIADVVDRIRHQLESLTSEIILTYADFGAAD